MTAHDDYMDPQSYKSGGMTTDAVMVPRKLTAENGAKYALSGEFTFSPFHDDEGEPIKVTVPWDTVKQIHDRIVFLFGSPSAAAIMYQSAVSGLWYDNEHAAGGIRAIKIGERTWFIAEDTHSATGSVRLMKQCSRHAGTPITITATVATAVATYCPNCEEESK